MKAPLEPETPVWLTALMPISTLLCVGSAFALSFQAALRMHEVLHPEIDGTHLSGIALLLMGAGAFLGSVTPGLMLANFLLWIAPPIRAAVEKHDPDRSFRETMLSLLTGAAVLLVLGVALAALGVVEPWSH